MGDEEETTLTWQILSFVFNSLCSIAIPVALSFYFAPDKSWEYFNDTVQEQIDSIKEIRWEQIYLTLFDVLEQVPPMLHTEKDVIIAITEAAPPAFTASYTQFISLDYRILLAILFVFVLFCVFFPWKACKEWIKSVLWGSICVVAGFLPIDSGLEVLEDKEAGPYKMIVMFCAVGVVLATNYLLVVSLWWIFTFSISYLWKKITGRSKKSKKGDKKKEDKGGKKKEKKGEKKAEKKVEKKKKPPVDSEEEGEREEDDDEQEEGEEEKARRKKVKNLKASKEDVYQEEEDEERVVEASDEKETYDIEGTQTPRQEPEPEVEPEITPRSLESTPETTPRSNEYSQVDGDTTPRGNEGE